MGGNDYLTQMANQRRELPVLTNCRKIKTELTPNMIPEEEREGREREGKKK